MRAGVRILGTSPADIARAEDRRLFRAVLDRLRLRQAASGTATSVAVAMKVARKLGFPVLVRPSFVLGGRAMEVVYSEPELEKYAAEAIKASDEHPVLIDRFLEDAVEVDVDAVCDGKDFVLGGIMEHIERAGVHSGDSACVLPPHSLPRRIVEELGRQTRLLAMALKVRGLINIQFAVKGSDVYVLEVNPRASRTVPFVGKATGVPLAGIAAKVMMGRSLKELGFTRQVMPRHFSVKEAVFPFHRFPGAEYALGPEMRSTGEVMGVDRSFGRAYAKSQLAAGQDLPVSGGVFLSLRNDDKSHALKAAQELRRMGFRLYATAGTAAALGRTGIWAEKVAKLSEGGHPNILDLVGSRKVSLIVNTSGGRLPRRDEAVMRTMALEHGVPLVTTVAGLQATVEGIGALRRGGLEVRCLQEYHRKPREHKRPPNGRRKGWKTA
jgi:carbamoyl-phosphate synthase large subunit